MYIVMDHLDTRSFPANKEASGGGGSSSSKESVYRVLVFSKGHREGGSYVQLRCVCVRV